MIPGKNMGQRFIRCGHLRKTPKPRNKGLWVRRFFFKGIKGVHMASARLKKPDPSRKSMSLDECEKGVSTLHAALERSLAFGRRLAGVDQLKALRAEQ
jgi:hypothetical protein